MRVTTSADNVIFGYRFSTLVDFADFNQTCAAAAGKAANVQALRRGHAGFGKKPAILQEICTRVPLRPSILEKRCRIAGICLSGSSPDEKTV
jgi:hypothetical protein